MKQAMRDNSHVVGQEKRPKEATEGLPWGMHRRPWTGRHGPTSERAMSSASRRPISGSALWSNWCGPADALMCAAPPAAPQRAATAAWTNNGKCSVDRSHQHSPRPRPVCLAGRRERSRGATHCVRTSGVVCVHTARNGNQNVCKVDVPLTGSARSARHATRRTPRAPSAGRAAAGWRLKEAEDETHRCRVALHRSGKTQCGQIEGLLRRRRG